ncbi:hypothetical protein EIP91_012075 [Steccherinum ochraceum]|uniref:54S ribosomal protein L11, mitochondrial n=1 Tax=Steccherinum ochraceum TaxID=92696 RepID=A0A4V2MXR2_9APHY|nr:hypothetical protein EIP91_012075 [Steccherinum ochraceum]
MLARLLRLPRLPSSPSSSRTYVVSIRPPIVYPKKKYPRTYNERKTYLYNQYARLLEESHSTPLIFLEHVDFAVPRLIQLRREIAAAALKHATPAPSLSSPTPAPVPPVAPALPTLKIMNGTLFGVVLRDHKPVDAEIAEAISEMVEGGFAVLSLPDLNPPQLKAVLRIMSRLVPPRKPKTPEDLKKAQEEAEKNFIPGRKLKRQRPIPVPDLRVVGALIEGRIFKAEGVKSVSELPTLDTLRAQLVGLISAPAAQLAGVLSQASGGSLARTLEGLKMSLEEKEGAGQDASTGSS